MSFETIELAGFAGGGEIEVPCDRIDAELDAIWRGIAARAQRPDAPGAGRISVHRACLLNLVVHAGDDPSEIVARFLATSLVGRLPARVILVRARPDAPGDGPPRAFVSATRHPFADPSHGGEQVSGELIVLDARGAQLERVPAVVRATLEPDLATTLWWTGPLPAAGRRYVGELRDAVDRVVVDSEEIADDADVAHVLPAAQTGRLADLAWPRLAPWRTVLARTFDPPAHREFLARVASVRVVVGSHGARRPEASAAPLLAGWLAAALGWRTCVCCGDRGLRFGDVAVWIEARASDLRGVVEVEFVAGRDVLRVRRTGPTVVEVAAPASFAPVRPGLFRDVDPVDALAATLLEVHADPIAPAAIRRAAEIGAVLCADRR